MEKLFAGLYIIVIALSFLCGGLLLQLANMNSQNNDMKNLMNQLENQTNELESKITNLEEQIYQKNLEYAKQVRITGISVDIIRNSHLVVYFVTHVKITNYGTHDVVGLTLSSGGSSKPVEQVNAGGTTTVSLDGASVGSGSGTVSLWFNDTKIDTKQYTHP